MVSLGGAYGTANNQVTDDVVPDVSSRHDSSAYAGADTCHQTASASTTAGDHQRLEIPEGEVVEAKGVSLLLAGFYT